MRPFITIERKAQAALDFYASVFPSFNLISKQNHAEPHADLIMVATFAVKNQEIMISDSLISHEWDITPGISFFIELQDADELDALSSSLEVQGKVHMPANDYGFSKRFAWVEDQFGVNWQLNVN